jgi:glycosyltransferase involved in cell wall biosynthesis
LAAWPIQLRRHFDALYTLEFSGFPAHLARYIRPGGQVLYGILGEPLGSISEVLYKLGVRKFTGIVVETEMQAEAARSAFRHGLPVRAIPNLGHFFDPPRRCPSYCEEFRVAFLGRYHSSKGVFRLLNLWPTLRIGPARLDFYGHGEEATDLELQIRARGLVHQVQVHGGWTNPRQLAAIFADTDLVVLPSETEGVPIILLEAMAHGIPFVASDVGAVRTLAEDNPDVRVVPLRDDELRHAIEEMARETRAGRVRGDRLQHYHRARYGYERLSEEWARALLDPESFWQSPLRRAV